MRPRPLRRVELLVGLHALALQVRPLLGSDLNAASRTNAKSLSSLHRLADTCRAFWDKRQLISKWLEFGPHRKQPMTCWMWPSSRMKSRFNWRRAGQRRGSSEGLAGLQEAEDLFGPN